MMGGHHDAEQEDNQGWHRIERNGVGAWCLACDLRFSRVNITSCRQHFNIGIQQVANSFRFDEHAALETRVSFTAWWTTWVGATHQTATKEHDRDGNMLKVLCSPCISPSGHMLHEDIGTAVEEDDEGLYEFSGWNGSLPLAHFASARLNIPCPPKVGEATHPSS